MLRWQPAIYEHKAALIGRGVAETAADPALLLAACREEIAVYGADVLVVGLDVYNVEAEACGARALPVAAWETPEVSPPFALDDLPRELEPPGPRDGRFDVFAVTGARLAEEHPDVRVAATGPFSLAAKLVGAQELLMAVALEDPEAGRLLDFAEAVAMGWLARLRELGLAAVIFDSLAGPPLLGPDTYRQEVAPRHRRMMAWLEASGQGTRELVMGGVTAPLAADLALAGATAVVCDYAESAERFAATLGERRVTVRRNVDPARLSSGDCDVDAFRRDLACFGDAVAGTGILPYHFDPSRYHEWKRRMLDNEGVSHRG